MSLILSILISICVSFFFIIVKDSRIKKLEKKLEHEYTEGYITCNANHMAYDMAKVADGNYILVSWHLFNKFRNNELWAETFKRACDILTRKGYHVVISPMINVE